MRADRRIDRRHVHPLEKKREERASPALARLPTREPDTVRFGFTRRNLPKASARLASFGSPPGRRTVDDRDEARRGEARRGEAGRGEAGRGEARRGEARHLLVAAEMSKDGVSRRECVRLPAAPEVAVGRVGV
ncbi:hypothetical protein KM043_004916 [Ampulex compressa]|nr:hypothetical protein KM043_004916 [Ampulex compressa]